ncbi:hypothetical protein FD35_GL001199 [Furfurilactobacillus rossiae DSM 15814]|uniref:HTH araC/xylS-type domain-containing protein n=2 Tax=Furfurilactobacillus rossiae TaxID=231049 RepID=A0A0R1RVD8_9LACO|nr:hypothetical protein FD35_GL001199 [Furfurilactobacillus rossiae DSM 15814]
MEAKKMTSKQRLLESEIAKLMKIQLVELDELGHIKRNVTDNDLDILDRALIKAAVQEVQQTEITMLKHTSVKHRQAFCFKAELGVIVCGVGFSDMDEQQLRLCALCLYVGLLGRSPLMVPKLSEARLESFHVEPAQTLIQAIAKENWEVLSNFVKTHFVKVTPRPQHLIGLTLIAGLFVGHQLTVNGRLRHFTELVGKWWQDVRNDDMTSTKLAGQLVVAFERRRVHSSRLGGDHLVNQIVKDINVHIETRLRVVDVAKRMKLSADYITRHFHQQTGWTLKQYILMRKVTVAKTLLLQQSVTEVCYRLHFGDQSHFAKVFKHYAGLTPHEYQRQQQDH